MPQTGSFCLAGDDAVFEVFKGSKWSIVSLPEILAPIQGCRDYRQLPSCARLEPFDFPLGFARGFGDTRAGSRGRPFLHEQFALGGTQSLSDTDIRLSKSNLRILIPWEK
jgi:hypothetical protein